MNTKTSIASLALLASLLFACGSKKPADSTTTGTGSATPVETQPDQGSGSDTTAMGSGSATETKPEEAKPEEKEPPKPPEPDAFMKLSKDEKMKIMKTQVLPAMAKAFKEYDPKKYAKITCKTCHGKGAETDFKMPSPDVPALDFAALKEGKQNPKMAEFMAKTVKPQMAKILGLTEYDEQHKDGFGCLHCHTMKQ